MRFAWIAGLSILLITSCDSQKDEDPLVYGLWRHTGTVNGFESYLHVQDSTLTFYTSPGTVDCFQKGSIKIERYEDGILIFDTSQRVLIPGDEPEIIEISEEVRYEFRRVDDVLRYRQLPDGELNEYEPSNLDIDDLSPACTCEDLDLPPEVCELF